VSLARLTTADKTLKATDHTTNCSLHLNAPKMLTKQKINNKSSAVQHAFLSTKGYDHTNELKDKELSNKPSRTSGAR